MNERTSRRAAAAIPFVVVFVVFRLVWEGGSAGAPIRPAPAPHNDAGWYAHRLVDSDGKGPLHRWRLWAAALNDGAHVGLFDGVGRSYVRLRNPNTPTIEFTARLCGRVYRLGDTIHIQPFTTILLEAVLTGAEGQTLHWIRAGEPVGTVEISESEVFRTTTQARPGDWFSIAIFDETGPTLLTSAIYTEAQ